MRKKILCGLVAIVMLLCLSGCKSNDYKSAQQLYADREYDDAIAMFTELGDYKDSADMINACNYGKATDLFDEEKYEEAAQIFEALGDYKDSEDMIETCATHAETAEKYDEAIAIYNGLRQNTDDTELRRRYAYLQLKNYIKENGEYFTLDETSFEDTAQYEYAIVSELSDYGAEKAILALNEDDEIVFVRACEDGDVQSDSYYFLFFYEQTLDPDSTNAEYVVDTVVIMYGAYILEVASGSLDIADYSDDYVFAPDRIQYGNRTLQGEVTEDDDKPLEGSFTEDTLGGVMERTIPAIADMVIDSGLTMNDLGYNY